MSIRSKIALASLVAVTLVWTVLAALSYTATGILLDVTSRALFSAATNEISLQIESSYQPVQNTTVLLADSRLVAATDLNERLESLPLLVGMLQQHHEALAIQVGYDNGDYFIVRKLLEPTLRERLGAPPEAGYTVDHFRGDRASEPLRSFYSNALARLGEMPLTGDGYDPRVRPWYRDAQASHSVTTTAPYVFYFMREIGVTIGKRSADGRAVVATDLALNSISRYLSRQRVTPGTEVLLRGGNGIIAWSGDDVLLETGDELRQRRLSDFDRPLFKALSAGQSLPGWLIHREPIAFAGAEALELVIAVPEHELMAEFSGIRRQVLLYAFVLLIPLVPFAWWLASRLTRSIRELHAAVEAVDRESFELTLPPVRGNDEVGALNLALGAMSDALRHYIADLEVATQARQKLESELDIARRIQMDLVPGGGELAASIGRDQLYACLRPARAVGGDLYEMQALDDGRYFLAVGDVSDKGMPAALFMSRAVALAKMLAPAAGSAAALLEALNTELVKGNESCMFITLFCGFYEPETGTLQFSCAGHNPPVYIGDDGPQLLELDSGTALGVFEGVIYHDQQMTLASGEELCVYTDGITEAFNTRREEFSEQRLLGVLSSAESEQGSARGHGESILQAVTAFAAGAAQSDDITLMILRRH
ncbi:SpoIIE family protein phosphatase [Gilvimarinus algae]|uniref:SpoIIE family protein phosphatase n=1 Tax=Gilvimarinus algae TaxID=3058037 RepID=A0ABT8TG49_9GAMM|nr:SpoIIE family protein phosphatase [Gilvimarinus sp. SDUM040014]MDO3383060.1 SpoIIE family protein phosphatase [Gilvimarinus sp. SDUM040014]